MEITQVRVERTDPKRRPHGSTPNQRGINTTIKNTIRTRITSNLIIRVKSKILWERFHLFGSQ